MTMARAFTQRLATLARESDAGVLLLAHVDKAAARYGAAGNSYSGSTAWHNSARSRLALAEADGGLELRQEKLNIGRLADPVRLVWSQHGVLVPASIGVLGTDGGDDDAVAVLSALRDATARNVSIPTARTGPSTAHRALETLDVLPRHLRGADGREKFWRALNLLQRSGCASSEEFRNRDRKIRTRIVVVEDAPIGAPANPPYPLLNRRSAGAAGAPVCASYETGAEPAQTGAACPRCAGEGCAFCSTHRPPTPQED